MAKPVDRVNFAITTGVLISVSIPLLLLPEASSRVLLSTYDWIAVHFGWLYLLTGAAALGFLLWIAFGRFGTVCLGDEAPEFSLLSWAAMLFSAGVGAGLMYWAAIEWASYFSAPPFAAEPHSAEAAAWASAYGLHHWGLVAWALYCVPTLAIAYPFYVRKVPHLKYSIAFDYWLAGRETSPVARFLDSLFMIALIGGAGSSLGFSTPLIAALVARLLGTEPGFGMEMAVVAACVVLFAGSVYLGLSRGIRRLSDLNMGLAFALLALVLFLGDTLFLLDTAVNAVGHSLQNFIRMTLWTDPFDDSGFVRDWTIFYWAWWVAYGPFVGLFVTRISRGRSLRGVVLGMLGFGSAGCWLFYMILGNHGLGLQWSGEIDLVAIMAASDGNQAIIAGLDALPASALVIALLCLVSTIFCATTYDSASYTLAAGATKSMHPSEDPARWHRLFWAFAIAILPISLMYIGGIREAQTAVLVVSLPLLFTLWLSGVALLKSLERDSLELRKTQLS
ncbi:BCCT family transporter [Congregibacter sp.]|uniref:BCCT family transporter n=1 Tax=Congregibacter sp. TaxID=2744308 RepID=UPI003F6D8845